MNLLESILLGFIQGITEFLPISSSGHLVIGNHILGIKNDDILFEVIVHLATLLAIIYYYKNDIIDICKGTFNKNKNDLEYLLFLIISTIPAVLIGLIFNNQIKFLYNIKYVPFFLLLTGFILFLSKFAKEKPLKLNYVFVFIIGLSQAFAILPGISRSGITITTALLLGINRKEASKFSFFMAIPVIVGALFLELTKLNQVSPHNIGNLTIGFIVSAFVGYFSISWLIKLINKLHFWKFSFYTWSIGIIFLINNYYCRS